MASLELLETGERFILSPRHVIGRASDCPTRLGDPGVSGHHVELIWDGLRWYAQDLGSRNGTELSSQIGAEAERRAGPGSSRKLGSGERVPLSSNDELVLAGSVRLRLIDDSPPHLQASTIDGQLRLATHDILSLPTDDEPELSIYRDSDGNWVAESEHGTRIVRTGEMLHAGGHTWLLSLPTSLPETVEVGDELRLNALEFRFFVSRDGEHVGLELHPPRSAVIPVKARSHLALLLVLGRARLADVDRGLPSSECGWLYRDDLPRMLGVQPHMINLWVHRARAQLAELGLRDAASIIERRASATQLRICAACIRITDA